MANQSHIPFGATSTAEEVLDGITLEGKRAVVTGAGSGLGAETARVLANAGAEVTMAVRNARAGEDAAASIREANPDATVHVKPLDLADPASVAKFVENWSSPLDILVNNAGIMACPEKRTALGWELQLATNHIGHFQLAHGLRPSLAAAQAARIVTVSSVGHVNGRVNFLDPNFDQAAYEPWLAYAQSKTANILFTVEAARRWAEFGIMANALNPGRIASTNLGRYQNLDTAPTTFDPAGATGVSIKNIAQGAATSVLLAASPLVDGVTGTYFEDCQPAVQFVPGVRRGVADYALDPADAVRLWDLSIQMLQQAGFPQA